jgi:hypothetical protein
MAIEKNNENKEHNMSNAKPDQGNNNTPPTTNQILPPDSQTPNIQDPENPLQKRTANANGKPANPINLKSPKNTPKETKTPKGLGTNRTKNLKHMIPTTAAEKAAKTRRSERLIKA